MRKITKKFDEVWAQADSYNKKSGFRFCKIFDVRDRYITMGIYDTQSKKYCLFDTINFSGNFRYSTKEVPEEIFEMEKLVQAAG
jgi:hypothetical protein